MRKMKKTDTKAQLWLDEAWGGGGGGGLQHRSRLFSTRRNDPKFL